MKTNILFLSFSLFLLISCKNNDKFLMGFMIGSEEGIWKRTLEENLAKGSFVDGEIKEHYKTSLNIKGQKVPIHVSLNYYLYSSGRLVEYVIRLPYDHDPRESYIDSFIHFDTLRLVYDTFIREYGKPDETTPSELYPSTSPSVSSNYVIEESAKDLSGSTKFKEKKNDTVAPSDDFISWWYLKDMIIKFYCSASNYSVDSIRRIQYAFISFESVNYDVERKRIIDSIVLSYTAKDYVNCTMKTVKVSRLSPVSYSEIYDREVTILFNDIHRGANVDTRDVVSFKYDIILVDEYNDELMKIEDQNHIFSLPLTPRKMIFYYTTGFQAGLITKYSSGRTTGSEKLEKAFSSGYTISARVEVKAVKLDDGTVVSNSF